MILRYSGNYLLDPVDWKQSQIPNVPLEQEETVMKTINRIVAAHSTNPATNTSNDQLEIDQLIDALHGLTDDEVAAVAGH